jgi:hypothetical protein
LTEVLAAFLRAVLVFIAVHFQLEEAAEALRLAGRCISTDPQTVAAVSFQCNKKPNRSGY